MNFAMKSKTGVVLSLLVFIQSVRAIDPLPPELENAPLAQQAAYWNRMAREGNEEKLAAGKQRWERRQILKSSLTRSAVQLADSRRQEYQQRSEVSSAAAASSTAEGFSWSMLLLLLSGGGLVGWYVYTRKRDAV